MRFDHRLLLTGTAVQNNRLELYSLLCFVGVQMRFDHRLLLTGTPVQNNLLELYSLLCFVAPAIFRYKYVDAFVNTYSDLFNTHTSNGLLSGFLVTQQSVSVFLSRCYTI